MKTLEIKNLNDKAIQNLNAVKGGETQETQDAIFRKRRSVATGEGTSMPG